MKHNLFLYFIAFLSCSFSGEILDQHCPELGKKWTARKENLYVIKNTPLTMLKVRCTKGQVTSYEIASGVEISDSLLSVLIQRDFPGKQVLEWKLPLKKGLPLSLKKETIQAWSVWSRNGHEYVVQYAKTPAAFYLSVDPFALQWSTFPKEELHISFDERNLKNFNISGTNNCVSLKKYTCKGHSLYDDQLKVLLKKGFAEATYTPKGNDELVVPSNYSTWTKEEKREWAREYRDYLALEYDFILRKIIEELPELFSWDAYQWRLQRDDLLIKGDALVQLLNSTSFLREVPLVSHKVKNIQLNIILLRSGVRKVVVRNLNE